MFHVIRRQWRRADDPAIADAVADMELKFGDQVPTGTYLDMTANLPVVDPARVRAPVLLLRGEYDGIATVDDLSEFYKRLPTGDRQFVILPGAAHSLIADVNRRLTWHTVRAFLSMPASAVSRPEPRRIMWGGLSIRGRL